MSNKFTIHEIVRVGFGILSWAGRKKASVGMVDPDFAFPACVDVKNTELPCIG
jgi:hypothetical protein